MKIGNIEIKNLVALAPMAGISNPSYMKLLEDFEVGVAFTELISAEAIVRDNKKTFDMLNGIEDINYPVGIQIFGSNVDVMCQAAKILTNKYKNIFIDINMGCPVPKVALRSQAGSALLKDPKKIYEMVSKVVKSVNVPVTVKIRTGWDHNSINAPLVAREIERAKASLITIHGRTRSDLYSGKVDLDIIKEVVESVNIPVIGNGDIRTKEDAKHMLEYTGCSMVMIGRATMGNPFIIKEVVDYLSDHESKKVTMKEKFDTILKHFNYLLKYKVEKLAILEMRSHFIWYLKGMRDTNKFKQEMMNIKTKEEFYKLIEEMRVIYEQISKKSNISLFI